MNSIRKVIGGMNRPIICFAVVTLLASCNQTQEASETSNIVTKGAFSSAAPLETEELGVTAILDADYPNSYVFAHNLNFYSILDGNVNIIDVAADTKEFKGMLSASQFATFAQSKIRNELYVGETFFSHGARGTRTDVLAVYDAATLRLIDEIEMPGGKRGQFVTQKGGLQLIDDDKLALSFNFTPASSVTVIDLNTRKIRVEIPMPGCMLTFPLKGDAFASLCSDGSISSYILDGEGVLETRSDSFNDIDNDPMFLKSTQIGDIRYFPTFMGNIRPIGVGGNEAQPLEPWSLVTDAERKMNWRPGGWQVVTGRSTGHSSGEIYVLMHEDGKDGSHKSGGSEVWVYDAQTQTRLRKITLNSFSLSIEVTEGDPGYLVVTNAAQKLDVYDLYGKHQREILVNDVASPFVLHASKP